MNDPAAAETWVMVPVPDDVRADAEAFLFQLRYRNAMGQWTQDLIIDHLASLEPEARTALTAVAAGVVSGRPITDSELAKRLGVSTREVFGIVRDANDVTVAPISGDLIGARPAPESAQGGTDGRRRVLFMFPWLAEWVHGEAEVIHDEIEDVIPETPLD